MCEGMRVDRLPFGSNIGGEIGPTKLARAVARKSMAKPPASPPIHVIRRQRVVLDRDLAKLYGVTTKVFNQAIQRNLRRFPRDFLFQLSREETASLRPQPAASGSETAASLRSQIVTLKNSGRGRHRKYLPWAFTEHGAIMAATVLRSARAVTLSVYVVRAFVRMRDELMANAIILKRLEQIDRKLLEHDVALRDLIDKLLPLLAAPPAPPRKEMGFHAAMRKS